MISNLSVLVAALLLSQSLLSQTPLEVKKLADFDRTCIDSASVIFEGLYLKTERTPPTTVVFTIRSYVAS
ncbi:MAG: hypothetical protein RI894_1487 [Bacteroidota bacterium]|jgi:hypothetical protein